MKLSNLGKSNIEIPKLSLGCANFGGIGSVASLIGKGNNRNEAFEIMNHSFDLGMFHFDTSCSYADGLSEQYIGDWIKNKGSNIRQDLVIATKVGLKIGDPPKLAGLGDFQIRKSIEKSLLRLQTDYIDIFYAHCLDPNIPQETLIESFNTLKIEGKIRHFAVCNVDNLDLNKSIKYSDDSLNSNYLAVQNSFSLIDRSSEKEIMKKCHNHNIAFIGHSPLFGGLLCGSYDQNWKSNKNIRLNLRPDYYKSLLNNEQHKKISELKAISKELNIDMVTLNYLWLMGHPLLTSSLIAPRTVKHFDAIKNAVSIDSLNLEVWEKISNNFNIE